MINASNGDQAKIGTGSNEDQDRIGGLGASRDEDMDEISTSSDNKEIGTCHDKIRTCHDEDQNRIGSNSDTN